MTAQKILELIESVDPSDVAALDEIDARVDAYVSGRPFNGYDKETGFYETVEDDEPTEWNPLKYTRSRDALKAARPEGWKFMILLDLENNGIDCHALFNTEKYGYEAFRIKSGAQKTEELAELHAIISAIEHERTKK